MLSIMHAKDALWLSLFFKLFFAYQIVISRRRGGDKNVKKMKDSLKIDRFQPHIPEIENKEIKTNSEHEKYWITDIFFFK